MELAEQFLTHKARLEDLHGFRMVKNGSVEHHLARWWAYQSGERSNAALLQELMVTIGRTLNYQIDPRLVAERLAEMP